jgi:hypothetical protein
MFFISFPVEFNRVRFTERCFTIDGPVCIGCAVDESRGIPSDKSDLYQVARQTDSRVGHFEVAAPVTLGLKRLIDFAHHYIRITELN